MVRTDSRVSLRLRSSDGAAFAAAAAMAAALTVAAWTRHQNYWSGGLDLGIFDQAMWLLSRGEAPEVTIVGHSIWADHFSPALLIFVPLYWVVATPLWLLLVQSIALGATVFPLRALARDVGVPPAVPTVLVVLSAPLLAAGMFDFHPWTLATPFIAWAVLAARRGDRAQLTIAALAVLSLRGDLLWVLLALLPVAHPAVRRRLVVVTVAGLAVSFAIPPLLGETGVWVNYYGHLGDSAFDAALHPWRAVRAVFTVDAGYTLAIALLPVGFLTIARPRWALAVVIAALPLMVSQWEGMHVPWFHYGASLAPVAIAGAVVALADLDRLTHPWVVLGTGVGMALFFTSPLAPNAPEEYRFWSVIREEPGVDYGAAIDAVREGEAVAANNRALPHLTHRKEVWPYPAPFVEVEPVGIGPDPDPEAAARITVVVVDPAEVESAQDRGFEPADVEAGRLYVGRRR